MCLRVLVAVLKCLQVLNASGNNLEQVPVPICILPRLRSLDLSSNKIRFLPPQVADSSTLTSLTLHSNELRQLPSSLASMARSVCSAAGTGRVFTCVVLPHSAHSLRLLIVYGNPIDTMPEALILHSAQAGMCLWRVCCSMNAVESLTKLTRRRNPCNGTVMQVAEIYNSYINDERDVSTQPNNSQFMVRNANNNQKSSTAEG